MYLYLRVFQPTSGGSKELCHLGFNHLLLLFFSQLKLWNKYRISNIPSLIFLDATSGKVVCRNGLLVIRDDPEGKTLPCLPTLPSSLLVESVKRKYMSAGLFG